MPLTQQRHYTVGYHDLQKNHLEICEYAMSAYDAIEHSKEDVPFPVSYTHLTLPTNREV